MGVIGGAGHRRCDRHHLITHSLQEQAAAHEAAGEEYLAAVKTYRSAMSDLKTQTHEAATISLTTSSDMLLDPSLLDELGTTLEDAAKVEREAQHADIPGVDELTTEQLTEQVDVLARDEKALHDAEKMVSLAVERVELDASRKREADEKARLAQDRGRIG